MSDIWFMDGNGPYVWVAYGITLVVVLWNAWSARVRLKRNLKNLGLEPTREEPARRPKVSQL
ncbi:MAG: heme exporter protein CcmD [Gammaproteobacteria bacterium]|jgi:heme exporter protein CcmD